MDDRETRDARDFSSDFFVKKKKKKVRDTHTHLCRVLDYF